MSKQKPHSNAVQTTGHAWDGDLQEYNNPLPTWWLWGFFITVAVSIGYWIIYPAWPMGNGFTTGLDRVTYVNDKGVEKTTHWNTRAVFMRDMNAAAKQQQPFFNRVATTPFEKIAHDPELANFVNSAGRALFSENCAACHQAGAQGKIGFAPNLTDDDWLYGGSYAQVQQTITNGRHGYMPAFKAVLSDGQIDSLAAYVLSLSGEKVDPQAAQAGNALFHSHEAACFYCHGDDAKGRQVIGSANLTDKIWLWADVRHAPTVAAKEALVKKVIAEGLDRGVMPAWGERLSPGQIKLLTAYVHDWLGTTK